MFDLLYHYCFYFTRRGNSFRDAKYLTKASKVAEFNLGVLRISHMVFQPCAVVSDFFSLRIKRRFSTFYIFIKMLRRKNITILAIIKKTRIGTNGNM